MVPPLLRTQSSLSTDIESLPRLKLLYFMYLPVQPGHQQHPEIPDAHILCQPGIMPVQPPFTLFQIQGTVSSSLRKALQCLSLSGRQAEFTGTGCLSVQCHADSSFQARQRHASAVHRADISQHLQHFQPFRHQNQHFTGHFCPQFTYPGQMTPPARNRLCTQRHNNQVPAFPDTGIPRRYTVNVVSLCGQQVPQPCQLIPAGSGQKDFLPHTYDLHHISTAQNITSVSTRHAIQVAATQTPTTHHIGINTFRCRAIRNTPPPVSDYPASVLPAPQHRGNSPAHHSGMSPRHRQYAGCHSPVTTATQRPK